MMKAPQIKNLIRGLRDGKKIFNKETNEAVDKVFEQLHLIKPCGDDGRRDIWLKAVRGTAEDYDDYEYLREEEIVDTIDKGIKILNEHQEGKIDDTEMVQELKMVCEEYQEYLINNDMEQESEKEMKNE